MMLEMKSEWKRVRFSDAPFEIIDGDRGKNYPKQDELLNEGHCVFLSAANVTKSGFLFSDCQFITKDKDDLLRKGKLKRGDIVLTTRGTLGNVGLYSDRIQFDHLRINSGMVILRSNDKELDARYLYYYMRSNEFAAQVDGLHSGVAQPQIPIKDLKSVEIPLPPLPTQKRIADILSAYDDLIENNRRRIEILEETARTLYRKCLKENAEGLRERKLGDFIDFLNGFAFKSNSFSADGKYKIITIKNVKNIFVDGEAALVDEVPPRMPEHCRIHERDILLSLTGNVGRLSIAIDDIGLLNQRVAKVQSQYPWFSYLVLSSSECFAVMNNLAVGVAQQNLSPVKLSNEKILIPSVFAIETLEEIVEPIFDQIVTLAKQNAKLAAARDMLLPRLMSGKLSVSAVEPLRRDEEVA